MAINPPSSKQQRAGVDSLDRISNLPKKVTDEIFKRVPITDAVKTSMLSTCWRYKWMSMPDLVFDTLSHSTIPSTEGVPRSVSLVNFVNNVLLLHNGNISKFEIYYFLESGVSDVDRWVLALSRTALNHLTLVFELSDSNPYPVPTCLFNCEYLTSLDLECCTLRLPSQYKGFKYLTNLDLYKINLTSETVENLVSKSPLLQSVTVSDCGSLTRLNLHAPNLSRFTIYGCCEGINFQHSPNLAHLSICTWLSLPEFRSTCRLDDILPNAASINYIALTYPLMEFSAADYSPKRLHTTYNCLKIVDLTINVEDSKQILAVLCLFRSSPFVEKVFLEVNWSRVAVLLHEEDFWEGHLCRERDIFNHLTTVSLSRFKGVQHLLNFVQFILLNAAVLDTLTIKWDRSVQRDGQLLPIIEKMMEFKRASCEAKVVFSGPKE